MPTCERVPPLLALMLLLLTLVVYMLCASLPVPVLVLLAPPLTRVGAQEPCCRRPRCACCIHPCVSTRKSTEV
jgi:hypothetical protein